MIGTALTALKAFGVAAAHRLVVAPLNFLISLLDEHKAFRRGLIVWACGLIGWTTHQMFSNMDKMHGEVVTAYGMTLGLLATCIGFYMKGRSDEDNDKGPPGAQ